MNCRRNNQVVGVTIAAAIVGAMGATGCGETSNQAPSAVADVALVLPDGALVSEIGYAVYAADGTTLTAGTKDYTDRLTPLSIGLALPPGNGYTMELAATSIRGDACDGLSDPFNITGGASTPVNVTLVCDPTLGYPDQCPVLASWSAALAPSPAPPGTINLYAFATDADTQDIVSYTWSAATGTFADPTDPSTTYTCASTAATTVTLVIDDHHQSQGCQTTAVLPVGCGAPQP
jgi:hypothetical protein